MGFPGAMEFLVIGAYVGHAVVVIVLLLVFARRLRRRNALKFSLCAALVFTIAIGALLGLCMYIAANSSLTVLGILVVLCPTPFWVVAGSEMTALHWNSKLVGPREAVLGATVGLLLYGCVMAALLWLSAATGVH